MRVLLKLFCIAVCLCCIGVSYATADKVVFPWMVKSQDVASLISIAHQGSDSDQLTFSYIYKQTIQNKPQEDCDEVSFSVNNLANRITSFDASGKFNNGYPIWSDWTGSTSGGGKKLSLPVTSPRRFALTVSSDGLLYGEAMVVDVPNGAAWGYMAFPVSDNATGTDNSTAVEMGEVWSPIIVKPNFYTKLFIAPHGAKGEVDSSYKVKAVLAIDPNGDVPGVTLADGTFVGTTKEIVIRGTGGIDIKDFFSEASWSLIKSSEQAFWGFLVFRPDEDGPAPHGVYAAKLEYAIGSGKVTQNAQIEGTFNNLVVLDTKPKKVN
ncbi:MAG: hypothetical protein QXO76_01125 [Thermoproteota archaeon]